MSNKLWDWIKSHKIGTALICVCFCIFQAFIIHVLHKWDIGIPFFAAEWNPGDVLAYVSGFEAFLGTVFLGLVSLDQSKKADETNIRLSKENNELQKIMSQRLIPVVQACSLKTTPTKLGYRTKINFPKPQSFTRKTEFNQSVSYEFIVNIDVNSDCEIHKKELSFSIENVSESILRHICIDGIKIQGYKNLFSPIICPNQTCGNGISTLLKAGEPLKVTMTFYFDNEKINEEWSNSAGGLSVILYLTNTTITGVVFHEYINITISDNKKPILSYGEGSFDEGSENNA